MYRFPERDPSPYSAWMALCSDCAAAYAKDKKVPVPPVNMGRAHREQRCGNAACGAKNS